MPAAGNDITRAEGALIEPPDAYVVRQSSASLHPVPHREALTVEEFQCSTQPSALPLIKPIRKPAPRIRSGRVEMVSEGDSTVMPAWNEVSKRPATASSETALHQESRLPMAFITDEEQSAEAQIGLHDSSSKGFQPRQPSFPVERANTLSSEALEEFATGRQSFPPVAGTRHSEVRDAEPPVEVKIGRVEVTFDAPPQQAPVRPPVPRGFDDYAPLRRYSPQAWNRWRR